VAAGAVAGGRVASRRTRDGVSRHLDSGRGRVSCTGGALIATSASSGLMCTAAGGSAALGEPFGKRSGCSA